MITCYFGIPGSGKSYEVVRYQLLSALEKGRLVITNLPLNMDALIDDYPDACDLVQFVEGSFVTGRDKVIVQRRPFSVMPDYQSDWKHPDLGFGPLYIIDECHFCYPFAATSAEEKDFLREVSEWYSMHRHLNVDVVLVTQSYGKVYKHIREMVETWVYLRNNRNFGFAGSYRRFAGSNPRGLTKDEVCEVRKYEKRIFRYYRTHTLGGKGKEQGPQDVKPIWQHPIFLLLGLVICLILFLVATDRFHPLGVLYAPKAAVVEPAKPVASVGSVSSAPVAPLPVLKEAVVTGRVGSIVFVKVDGRVQSLADWTKSGATVIGQVGVCPWALVLKDGPAKGVCS